MMSTTTQSQPQLQHTMKVTASSPLKLYTSGAMHDPSYPLNIGKTPKIRTWTPKGSFRFLDLPLELREKIYEFALALPETYPQTNIVDLDPQNRLLAKRLKLLCTCRQIYAEAYPVFYGRHTFRIFPTHPGYLNAKEPILMRLPRHIRKVITSLELRLGPGWSKPPRCQSLTRGLWLKDCRSVRHLKVFVELDPSHDIFKGYRKSDTFYTVFSSELLKGVLHLIPSIRSVEFDAYPSVRKCEPLMSSLLIGAGEAQKQIMWGPLRGWDDGIEEDPSCDVVRVEKALAALVV